MERIVMILIAVVLTVAGVADAGGDGALEAEASDEPPSMTLMNPTRRFSVEDQKQLHAEKHQAAIDAEIEAQRQAAARVLARTTTQTTTEALTATRGGYDITQYAADVFVRIGAPNTPENQRAFAAWASFECINGCAYNPLATSMSAPGASSLNSHGVKSYPSYDVGVDATARTLLLNFYTGIVAAFRDGTSAVNVGHAVEATPWGTKGGLLRVLAAT